MHLLRQANMRTCPPCIDPEADAVHRRSHHRYYAPPPAFGGNAMRDGTAGLAHRAPSHLLISDTAS